MSLDMLKRVETIIWWVIVPLGVARIFFDDFAWTIYVKVVIGILLVTSFWINYIVKKSEQGKSLRGLIFAIFMTLLIAFFTILEFLR